MSRKDDNRPIGIFDSGLGGLTVVSALSQKLPDEDLIYLGDTARVPYGDKSVDAIISFALQDVDFLLKRGVKAVVIACNTVSAVAMEAIRQKYEDLPLFGVLEAGVMAVMRSGAGKITVIGTRATVNSDAYRRSLHAEDPSLVVESIACPLFVPLAEEGLAETKIAEECADLYLGKLRKDPPDALLLGCTHYPLFRKVLSEYLGSGVKIIDSAGACAEYVQEKLLLSGMTATPGKGARISCFVTDMPSTFHDHAAHFFSGIPERVEKIVLQT